MVTSSTGHRNEYLCRRYTTAKYFYFSYENHSEINVILTKSVRKTHIYLKNTKKTVTQNKCFA